jgi:hypothetical protein
VRQQQDRFAVSCLILLGTCNAGPSVSHIWPVAWILLLANGCGTLSNCLQVCGCITQLGKTVAMCTLSHPTCCALSYRHAGTHPLTCGSSYWSCFKLLTRPLRLFRGLKAPSGHFLTGVAVWLPCPARGSGQPSGDAASCIRYSWQ